MRCDNFKSPITLYVFIDKNFFLVIKFKKSIEISKKGTVLVFFVLSFTIAGLAAVATTTFPSDQNANALSLSASQSPKYDPN